MMSWAETAPRRAQVRIATDFILTEGFGGLIVAAR